MRHALRSKIGGKLLSERHVPALYLLFIYGMVGWMDGWMDGWIDGWIDRYILDR